MDWVEFESFRLICPYFADVFVWGEALERLQTPGVIVPIDKVREMASEVVVAVVMIALDGCVLDRPVHAFDLPVGPWMVRLGQPVINAVLAADLIEAKNPVARRPAIPITGQVGKLDTVTPSE